MLTEAASNEFHNQNPLRRILVNSIPKSGTTWVRTMLSALPGYTDYSSKKANGLDPSQLLDLQPGQVFHGHMKMSDILMQNIHDLDIATVYVFRDLRDSIVSDYFHKSVLNPNRANEYFRQHDKETLFMADNLKKWCVASARYPDVRKWLAEPSIPTVTYEALKFDPHAEMSRVLREMGFNVSDEIVTSVVSMGAFETMSGGRDPGDEDLKSHRRKGIVGDWRNHFSQENIRSFKEKYGHLLIEYEYEKDNNW